MLSCEIKKRLKELTIDAYPNECCALITADTVIPIKNVSARPIEGFVMCPIELAAALDNHTPIAIFHSHPDDTAHPSGHDLVRMSRADNPLPWVIMSWPDYDMTVTQPQQPAKLIGREFVHGAQDCYTLVQDFYKAKLGSTLR